MTEAALGTLAEEEAKRQALLVAQQQVQAQALPTAGEQALTDAITGTGTPPAGGTITFDDVSPGDPGTQRRAPTDTGASGWPEAFQAMMPYMLARMNRQQRSAPGAPIFGLSGGGVRGGPLSRGIVGAPPRGVGRRKRARA